MARCAVPAPRWHGTGVEGARTPHHSFRPLDTTGDIAAQCPYQGLFRCDFGIRVGKGVKPGRHLAWREVLDHFPVLSRRFEQNNGNENTRILLPIWILYPGNFQPSFPWFASVEFPAPASTKRCSPALPHFDHTLPLLHTLHPRILGSVGDSTPRLGYPTSL